MVEASCLLLKARKLMQPVGPSIYPRGLKNLVSPQHDWCLQWGKVMMREARCLP